MKYIAALTLLSLAFLSVPFAQAEIIESFGAGTNSFTMIFVPIGNPGNAPDTTGSPNPAGSVGYHYNMGKYEVSRDMVTKVNAEGNLGIIMQDLVTDFGIPTGNDANRPATGVSWNEAARFVNWLNISQGYSPAYKFAVQPGQPGYFVEDNITLWQATDPGYNAANEFRNSQARYFLPSVDEWYKAAYHKNDGVSGNYWEYPTGSDFSPIPVSGGTAAGTAVYARPYGQGPSDIDNAGGLSPYGVMGLGGNVREWEETIAIVLNPITSSFRGIRGGSWRDEEDNYSLSQLDRGAVVPWSGGFDFGFRVASIPNQILPAEITSSFAFHRSWSGIGSNTDSRAQLHRAGNVTTTLSFNNLLNSSHGINGIGFDIARLPTGAALSLQDFNFQVSPQGVFSELLNPPQNWASAPIPSMVSTTALPGTENLSRVSIEWPNNAIENRWLRITVKFNANTGLTEPEVYYLGHLRGETTGPSGNVFSVSYAQDLLPIRLNLGTNVSASSAVDIDKNGLIQFADIVAMRTNAASQLTQITILGSGGGGGL
jgi:sulfatase modifying factor 1